MPVYKPDDSEPGRCVTRTITGGAPTQQSVSGRPLYTGIDCTILVAQSAVISHDKR